MDEYTGIARLYDACTAAFLRKPRHIMAAASAATGARRILDIGCGTGIFARILSQNNGFVAGTDHSPAMLRAAPPHSPRNSGPALVLADAARPPFSPGSFDLLTYALVLHETPSNAEALLLQGFTLAPLALVLEWRLPERNLDCLCSAWVHLIERLAGKEHYKRFRAFMRHGGIHGLAHKTGAAVLSERPLKGGSLVLVLLRKPERITAPSPEADKA